MYQSFSVQWIVFGLYAVLYSHCCFRVLFFLLLLLLFVFVCFFFVVVVLIVFVLFQSSVTLTS